MCHEMEKYNKNISKITQNTTLQKNKQRLQNINTWNKRHFFKNIVLIIITFFLFLIKNKAHKTYLVCIYDQH